jgi:hypothetical protein
MRQGQQNNKRMRGRGGNNNNPRKGPNPLTRSYESNGPDVKIRGTALHIAEKYVQLARDAQSSGDRVMAENYLQHAEHYYRIVAAAQAAMPQPQQALYRPDEEGDEDASGADERFYSQSDRQQQAQDRNYTQAERPAGERPFQQDRPAQERGFAPRDPDEAQPAFGLSDPQPYLNGNGNGHGGEMNGHTPSDDAAAPGAEGDQPQYRMRRRRPNRGRGSRQEGDAQGQLPVSAAESVASGGDGPFGED